MASTQLKYIGESPIDLYRPAGDPRSLLVELGDVVETPGEVLAADDDAIVTGSPEDPRAWPKSSWSLEGKATVTTPAPAAAKKSTAPAEQKES